MVSEGQVFSKRRKRGRGQTLFLFNFIKVYHFYIQKIFTLCQIVLNILGFFCHHNFMERSHCNSSKEGHRRMCMESCSTLGQESICLLDGRRNCLKFLKRWHRKEGRKKKLIKGGKPGQGEGCLKREQAGILLRTIIYVKLKYEFFLQ